MVMAFGRLAEPIRRGSGSIRFVLVIGIPETMDADYLRLVGALMRAFKNSELRKALERAKKQLAQVHFHDDPYKALEGVHAALVCTEWDVYKKLDWERAAKVMARKLVIDGRNLYDPEIMAAQGFTYFSVGRPASHPDGVPAAVRNGKKA